MRAATSVAVVGFDSRSIYRATAAAASFLDVGSQNLLESIFRIDVSVGSLKF